MFDDADFTDVSLVSDDNKHISVHRAVLSASSIFFRRIFYSSLQKPMVTHDVKATYLTTQALVSFIYLGHCSVHKDNIDELVLLSHEWKVELPRHNYIDIDRKRYKYSNSPVNTLSSKSVCNMEQKSEIKEKANAGKGRKMLEDYIAKDFSSEDGGFLCIICNKSFNRKCHTVNHLENIHFPDVFKYPCKHCSIVFTSKNVLYKHVHKEHRHQEPALEVNVDAGPVPGHSVPDKEAGTRRPGSGRLGTMKKVYKNSA